MDTAKISDPQQAAARQTATRLTLGLGGAMALGGCVMLYFFNPSKYHIYPVCEFHQLTGLHCPGCGATRALYALLHGDLPTALHDNALLVLLMVAWAGRGLWLGWEKWRGRAVGGFFPAWTLWVVLTLAVVFGVVRNLPWFSFLAPI
jgi:hypothetical protein